MVALPAVPVPVPVRAARPRAVLVPVREVCPREVRSRAERRAEERTPAVGVAMPAAAEGHLGAVVARELVELPGAVVARELVEPPGGAVAAEVAWRCLVVFVMILVGVGTLRASAPSIG